MQLLSESLKPVVVRMHLAVARDIALAIARGSITVGEALPNDRELSEQYQASRTVIREAIQHLAVRRVLEVRPGSGTYAYGVQTWDLNDAVLVDVLDSANALGSVVHDLLGVRRMIECEAAALAAQHATREDIAQLRAILVPMLEQRADVPAYLELHGRFHRQVLVCSHNRLLIALQQQIDALQRAVLRRHFSRQTDSGDPVPSIIAPNPHEMLVECIETRDVEHARSAMLIHTRSLERVASALFPQGRSQ